MFVVHGYGKFSKQIACFWTESGESGVFFFPLFSATSLAGRHCLWIQVMFPNKSERERVENFVSARYFCVGMG